MRQYVWLTGVIVLATLLGNASAQRVTVGRTGSNSIREFRDLFKVGQWATVSGQGAQLTIQLMTDEEKMHAELLLAQFNQNRQERRSEFESMQQQIQSAEPQERARLLEQLRGMTAARPSFLGEPLSDSFYRISRVGADYVALTHNEIEQFVPFTSLRSVAQTAPAAPAATSPGELQLPTPSTP